MTHAMMTSPDGDWVRRWRRHRGAEWTRGTCHFLHQKTGFNRARYRVTERFGARFHFGISRQQFGASEAVDTGWQLRTWVRWKAVSIILKGRPISGTWLAQRWFLVWNFDRLMYEFNWKLIRVDSLTSVVVEIYEQLLITFQFSIKKRQRNQSSSVKAA